MKRLKLLATFIFLAHNAWAGWHTNEPFVAWPATNHLRWMTNVGTYTNASHWTNSAYGQWTNNYIGTNIYIGTNLVWNPYEPDIYWLEYGPFTFPMPMDCPSIPTNVRLNAKDVRIVDCTLAIAERLSICGWTSSNVWQILAADIYEDGYYDSSRLTYDAFFSSLFRDERITLKTLKGAVANYVIPARTWYLVEGTNRTQLNESMICSNAAVPPNYLRYTPYRAADMTSTAYGRIVTNSWTLATTNAGFVTNTFIDSFQGTHDLAGTNGQTFTLTVTNANIAEGYRAEHYGWDGLKAVITNLAITSVGSTWGIGSGTNCTSNAPISKLYASVVHPPPIDPVYIAEGVASREAIEATNGWAAYTAWDYPTPKDWEWEWSLANPSAFIRTNIAPYINWQAWMTNSYSCYIKYSSPSPYTNWTINTFYTNAWTGHSSAWTNYAAPIVAAGDGPISRTLEFWYKSNSIPVMLETTNIGSGYQSTTSSLVTASSLPIPTSFGYHIYTDGLNSYSGGSGVFEHMDCWFLFATNSYPWGMNYSTNAAGPTYQNNACYERWDFVYK